ncbi:LiaF transmembrane domain-containing protein [Mucilaginibacter paludis]|uniref:LiaF transmembrane domain-containing protein n=1 Tax=Mucilaginibacter paludis DSM 18603 TaxID=714943 RepID=H1YBT8_9SPHI|nr:DUF5668 domain-containing protein [Mucilaginibacter paludis]EHQ26051.1 hypothetical protein Mucpa_1904 [Mucilaginibacter paludis DSM 18603]
MYNDSNNSKPSRQNNRTFAGLFLVGLGGIYLLRQLDFIFFPTWLFSWPMILILIGLISGIKHNFRHPGAYVMMFIGSVFLLGHIINISIYFLWPLVLIAIGIRLLVGKDDRWCRDRWERRMQWRRDVHQETKTL